MSFEDEPTPTIPCPTRRERRADRERARPPRSLVGWFGYGVAVTAVIVGAAWMASATQSAGHTHHASRQPTASVVSTR